MENEIKELLSSKEMNLPHLREVKLKLPLQGNFSKLVNKIKRNGESIDSIFVHGFFGISKKDNVEKVTVDDFYRTFHFDLKKDESEIEGYTYFGFLDKVSYKAKLDKKFDYSIKAFSKKNDITYIIIKIVFRNQFKIDMLKRHILNNPNEEITISSVYNHVNSIKKITNSNLERPCTNCTNHGCQGDCEQWCGGSMCNLTCGTSCNKNCSTICYRDNWDGNGPYMNYV